MGGYGAIRLGGHVGAQVTPAISPHFSIDPAVAAFEPRWVGDSGRIDFQFERRAGHDFIAKAYVVYDPHDLDARHVEILSAPYQDRRRQAAQLRPSRLGLHGRYQYPAAGHPRSVPWHVRYPGAACPGATGPTWLTDPACHACRTLPSRAAPRAIVG
ncbi:MAG: hypothetical protein LCH93_10035 [Proteobacteria bacterium]|nr:hypothetical protein [Pseudomonadota bacterium]